MNSIHMKGLDTFASGNDIALTSRSRYMVNPKSESREEIVSIIHRALAEVMVLRQVNLPLEIDKDAKYTTNEYVQRIAKGARFQVTHENQVSLLLEDEALQDAILDCINPKEAASEGSVSQEENSLENDQREEKPGSLSIVAAEESIGPTAERGEIDVSTPEEAEAVKYEALPEEHHLSQITEDPSLYTPVDDSWRGVALTHPGFKFAVCFELSHATFPEIDNMIGAQACHATEWQAHSRSRYPKHT